MTGLSEPEEARGSQGPVGPVGKVVLCPTRWVKAWTEVVMDGPLGVEEWEGFGCLLLWF